MKGKHKIRAYARAGEGARGPSNTAPFFDAVFGPGQLQIASVTLSKLLFSLDFALRVNCRLMNGTEVPAPELSHVTYRH